MLSIKDSKNTLSQMGMSDDKIALFEKYSLPFIDFHKHLMKIHDISSEAAEKLSKECVNIITNEYIENNNIDDLLDYTLAGIAIEIFAKQQNYDDAYILKENTTKLVEILTETFKSSDTI